MESSNHYTLDFPLFTPYFVWDQNWIYIIIATIGRLQADTPFSKFKTLESGAARYCLVDCYNDLSMLTCFLFPDNNLVTRKNTVFYH